MTIRTYSPKNWSLKISTLDILGFADDSFISVEPREDVSEITVGADGEATVHVSPDDGGTLTFTIKSTTPVNEILHKWVSSWQAAKGVGSVKIGDFTFDANDALVATLVNSNTGERLDMIGIVPSAFPNVEATRQAPDREWKFHVGSIKRSYTQIAINAGSAVQTVS